MTKFNGHSELAILLATNSTSKHTILGYNINTSRASSAACNSTQLHLVQLQASKPVTRGITQIVCLHGHAINNH